MSGPLRFQQGGLVGVVGVRSGGGSLRAMTSSTLPHRLRPHPSEVGFDTPTGASNRQSDVYNRLLQDRIVVLGSDVNDELANFIMAQLLYLEGQDAQKPIWLYINSPGGSVTSGMAIYDTMQFIQPAVGTICIGLGASMGQFLLCAGAPASATPCRMPGS